MKNLKYILLSLIALTLLFAACTDLSKDSSGSQEKTEYTLVGSLSLAGVSRAAYSRTATSSFSDELIWTITAKKGEKTYLPKEMSDTSFSFAFEETGEYTIEAKALKDGQAIAQGSTSCTVSKGGDNFAQIIATPHACTIPGSVNLVINLDTVAADNVASVYVEWQAPNFDRTAKLLGFPIDAVSSADGKTPEISEEVQAAMDAFYAWAARCGEGEFNKSFDVVNGKVTISFDDISCGAHNVNLSFNDSIGNTLYSCPEIINVYSGFTTDTWYGTSPYLSNGTFTLTTNSITNYGAEPVPNTQMVLYNYVSYDSFDYYLDSKDEEPLVSDGKDSFCFDDEGNLFVISDVENKKIGDEQNYRWYDCITKVFSNRENFGTDGELSFGSDTSVEDIRGFQSISYDIKNKKLYGIVAYSISNDSGATYTYTNELYEYPIDSITSSWNWTSGDGVEKHYSIDGIESELEVFTVHDGILYVPYKITESNSTTFYLLKVNLEEVQLDDSDNTYKIHASSIGSMTLSELSGLSGNITDCMYQDGCLYFLVKESRLEYADRLASRGAVVRVDLIANKTDYIGWTSNPIDSDNIYMYAYYDAENEGNYYADTDKSIKVLAKVSDLYYRDSGNIPINGLYVPEISEELSSSAFYGPEKFIAIKPKKLVIADNGVAMYVDDNNALMYKNVNRTVIIDLERFAIDDSQTVVVDVAFSEKKDKPLFNSCSFPGEAFASSYYREDDMSLINSTASVYYSDSSSKMCGSLQVAIPCGDND